MEQENTIDLRGYQCGSRFYYAFSLTAGVKEQLRLSPNRTL